MKKRFLFCLFFFLPVGENWAQEKKWDASMYKKYDIKGFESSELAKSKVDAKKLDNALLNAAIFYATNKEREKLKLPLFTHSRALEKAALDHSKEMAQKNNFSHKGLSKGRETHIQRLAQVGVMNLATAENIAKKYSQDISYKDLGKEIVLSWMKSEKHKENIISKKYKFLGCGAYEMKDKEFPDHLCVMVTQDFSAIDSGLNEFKD